MAAFFMLTHSPFAGIRPHALFRHRALVFLYRSPHELQSWPSDGDHDGLQHGDCSDPHEMHLRLLWKIPVWCDGIVDANPRFACCAGFPAVSEVLLVFTVLLEFLGEISAPGCAIKFGECWPFLCVGDEGGDGG